MNGAHAHLLINHFPLIGLVFSVLFLGLGLFRKNASFVQSGLLIAFISGALTIPAFLSGEPAEEVVEHLPGISETIIEEHEEAAELAIWVIGLTATAAAAGLYFSYKRNGVPQLLLIVVVVLNLLSLVAIARTNNLGGKISHPEIQDTSG